eukprot:SAG31_NODE_37182_length_306_cov_1.120773_1_plen_31_part_10
MYTTPTINIHSPVAAPAVAETLAVASKAAAI